MLSTTKLRQAVLAEFAGTAALLCAVIGSGIMGERLAGGNAAIALLANTLATVFALYVLVETLAPVSGAHFNPVVTLVMTALGRSQFVRPWSTAGLYVAAQLAGAVGGALFANAMFALPVVEFSARARTGWEQWLAEAVATLGLLAAILLVRKERAAGVVAAYIGAAYWFTSSTSFANPAAVVGRMLSDTFAGIAPSSAPGFVSAQLAGGLICMVLWRASAR